MSSRLARLAALLVLVATGPAGPAQARASDEDAFTARLDAELPGMMKRLGVPGLSVALMEDGELAWSKGYGLADVAARTPMTAGTIFQMASVSKAVTAACVLRLVDEGLIDLDAPVETYLTRWHLPPSDFDPDGVTIRRLLGHTAGLSLHGYPGLDPARPLPSLEESLSGDTGGAGDVRLVRPPGEAFMYSGGGYTLLTLVVEEVTGRDYCEVVDEKVLRPLGMTSSGYCLAPGGSPRMATAYDAHGRPLPWYRFGGIGCCGLASTAPDLARLAAALVNGPDGEPPGRGVLAPGTVALMMEPQAPITEGIARLAGDAIGLGWFLETLPGGERLVSHGGDNRGWHVLVALLPERRAGLVVAANGDAGMMLRYTHLLRWWLESRGATLPRLCRVERTVTWTAVALAAALGLVFLLAGWRLVTSFLGGRRRWGWVRRPALLAGKSLLAAVAVVLVGVWWQAIYPIQGILSPFTAPWLAAAITLCGLLMFTAAVSRKAG
ncbi:MAG: beta-lactamase family protein [Candidatus Krumholzibacteriota bacterium]|nr:beta-lactamase family protein [Candidatus Krumholzibacteriota bacterium]